MTTDSAPAPGDIHEAATQPPLPARSAWAQRLYRYRMVILPVYLVCVLGLDQWTKHLVREDLARPLPADARGIVHYRPIKEVVLLRGLFHLRYVENPAAAFSLTRSIPVEWRLPMLISITWVALALLTGWLWRLREPDAILALGFILVIGGASGNLVDRMLDGYVVDFIDWRLTRWFPTLPPWPTFNIADMSIVGGAACIIFRSFFPFERGARREPAAAAAVEQSPAPSAELRATPDREDVSA